MAFTLKLLLAVTVAAAMLQTGDSTDNSSKQTDNSLVTNVIEVEGFDRLFASASLQVNVTTVASMTTSPQVSITAESHAVSSRVEVHVFFGTLIVTLSAWGPPTSKPVMVSVQVPQPLYFMGATLGARIFADAVAGPLSASGRGEIHVGAVNSPGVMSIDASSSGKVHVQSGNGDYATISASSLGEVELGELTLRRATISASSGASVSGLVTETCGISVSSGASVNVTVTRGADVTCSSHSRMIISGGAHVTEYFVSRDCFVEYPKKGKLLL